MKYLLAERDISTITRRKWKASLRKIQKEIECATTWPTNSLSAETLEVLSTVKGCNSLHTDIFEILKLINEQEETFKRYMCHSSRSVNLLEKTLLSLRGTICRTQDKLEMDWGYLDTFEDLKTALVRDYASGELSISVACPDTVLRYFETHGEYFHPAMLKTLTEHCNYLKDMKALRGGITCNRWSVLDSVTAKSVNGYHWHEVVDSLNKSLRLFIEGGQNGITNDEFELMSTLTRVNTWHQRVHAIRKLLPTFKKELRELRHTWRKVHGLNVVSLQNLHTTLNVLRSRVPVDLELMRQIPGFEEAFDVEFKGRKAYLESKSDEKAAEFLIGHKEHFHPDLVRQVISRHYSTK